MIHYGGLDFHTVLRRGRSPKEYEGLKQRLLEAYKTGSLADVTTLVTREFEGQRPPARRPLRRRAAADHRDRPPRPDRGLPADLRAAVRPGRGHAQPAGPDALPDPEAARRGGLVVPRPPPAPGDRPARHATASLARIRSLCERGKTWGYQPERELLAKALSEALRRTLGRLDPDADLPALAARADQLLDAASLLGSALDLWQVQNQLLDSYSQLAESGAMTEAMHDHLAKLAAKLNLSRDLLGWRP